MKFWSIEKLEVNREAVFFLMSIDDKGELKAEGITGGKNELGEIIFKDLNHNHLKWNEDFLDCFVYSEEIRGER